MTSSPRKTPRVLGARCTAGFDIMLTCRKATAADIPAVCQIYADVHTVEESGPVTTGWKRETYPVRETAEEALARDDLFVQETGSIITGTAIINRIQVDVYEGAPWRYPAPDEEVMVLHTLAISPKAARQGLATDFVDFYARYALEHGCRYLRIDTNEKNAPARALYKKLGFAEVSVAPCTFNGLEGVRLLLLEKKL